ncbi:MAG TPA: hypothetical protein VKU94_07120 [Geobacterales bacterium]|nr:hypothetical protein [Geobacterales bacterium]
MGTRISIEKDVLKIELTGFDEFFTFKRIIRIPLNKIVEVSTEKVDWGSYLGWRILGANIPKIIKDGIYSTSEGLIFFVEHNPEKCITLTLKDFKYKKIIIEVDNKEEIAEKIREIIKNR